MAEGGERLKNEHTRAQQREHQSLNRAADKASNALQLAAAQRPHPVHGEKSANPSCWGSEQGSGC